MKTIRSFCMVVALAGILGCATARAQGPADDGSLLGQSPQQTIAAAATQTNTTTQTTKPQAGTTTNGQSPSPDATTPKNNPPADPNNQSSNPSNPDDQYGKQSKRILGIIPNYRAVSANSHLPPLSFTEKFWLATQDTFDYSDFVLVGGLAGLSMSQKSQPAFGQGAAGYGRYYWHTFVDGGIENYMTEAIVPTLTREDPRYYTLGKGGFFKRTGYAVSRLFITRTDSGNKTFNISEIVGAGAAAGIANTYYPPQSNTFVKTYQRWGTEVGLDGVFDVLKEFWPDINHAVFHGKY